MLSLAPIGLRQANEFVKQIHRHHGATAGHKFSVAAVDAEGQLRGVAIAGRPKARLLDDGTRLEVLRVATDGARNACSLLYSAAARAGQGMGYAREDIFTYILLAEEGASLRAAGWVEVASSRGGTWDRGDRPRTDTHPTGPKRRFHAARPPEWWPKPKGEQ